MNYVVDKYKEENFPADHFICLLLGVIDLKTNEVIISNAGFQIPPLIVSHQKELKELTEGGMPISSLTLNNLAFELDFFTYGESTVQLKPGTTIFITTDGLIEENIAGNREINSSYQQVKNTQEDIIQFSSDYLDLDSQIELAIGAQELMLNSLEHGNQRNVDKKIKVTAEVTAKYIKLNITDEGFGFDWKKYINQELKLTVDKEQEFHNERGWEIKLVNTACDYLWYNEKGNQAYLLKLRDREVDNNAEYFS